MINKLDSIKNICSKFLNFNDLLDQIQLWRKFVFTNKDYLYDFTVLGYKHPVNKETYNNSLNYIARYYSEDLQPIHLKALKTNPLVKNAD